MNKKDRIRLSRLYACMSSWPWWNRNHTAGVADLSNFAASMQRLQPLFCRVIADMVPSWDTPEDECERSLDELEKVLEQIKRNMDARELEQQAKY